LTHEAQGCILILDSSSFFGSFAARVSLTLPAAAAATVNNCVAPVSWWIEPNHSTSLATNGKKKL
jgi:hypothetical protein